MLHVELISCFTGASNFTYHLRCDQPEAYGVGPGGSASLSSFAAGDGCLHAWCLREYLYGVLAEQQMGILQLQLDQLDPGSRQMAWTIYDLH